MMFTLLKRLNAKKPYIINVVLVLAPSHHPPPSALLFETTCYCNINYLMALNTICGRKRGQTLMQHCHPSILVYIPQVQLIAGTADVTAAESRI